MNGYYYRECEMKMCEIDSIFHFMKLKFVCADLQIADDHGGGDDDVFDDGALMMMMMESRQSAEAPTTSDLFMESIIQMYLAASMWMTEKQDQMLGIILACSDFK